MENKTSINHENGNDANPLLPARCSCINCKNYYFAPPQHDQPYPEFACLKGHWDGISCKEHYDELFNEINCEDFTHYY